MAHTLVEGILGPGRPGALGWNVAAPTGGVACDAARNVTYGYRADHNGAEWQYDNRGQNGDLPRKPPCFDPLFVLLPEHCRSAITNKQSLWLSSRCRSKPETYSAHGRVRRTLYRRCLTLP
jgi:hypothetical protein